MKYEQLPSFLNHFRTAHAANHLSCIYGIFGMNESDRSFIVKELLKIAYPGKELLGFKAPDDSVASVLERLNSFSLFEKATLVYFEGVDKLKKEELASLSSYLENPCQSNLLLLGGGSSKGLAQLLQKGKKEIVFLDLTAEKPWEKPMRLKSWVELLVKERKKTLHTQALAYLLANCEADIQALEQTLDQLLCFVGEKAFIEKKDVVALLPEKNAPLSFSMAEALLYGKLKNGIEIPKESASLIPLLGAFRYQLQLGQKIVSLRARKVSVEEMLSFLPQVKRQNLEKLLVEINALPQDFFSKGLCLLFEIELKAKSSGGTPEELFTELLLRLETYKRAYV